MLSSRVEFQTETRPEFRPKPLGERRLATAISYQRFLDIDLKAYPVRSGSPRCCAVASAGTTPTRPWFRCDPTDLPREMVEARRSIFRRAGSKGISLSTHFTPAGFGGNFCRQSGARCAVVQTPQACTGAARGKKGARPLRVGTSARSRAPEVTGRRLPAISDSGVPQGAARCAPFTSRAPFTPRARADVRP